MAEKATSIVRVESFLNHTPTGRASATGARRLAHYFAYGRGTRAQQQEREQRGQWYSEEGKQLRHEEVVEWVNREGKAHSHTHQFILSTRHGRLSPEAYGRALQAGGDLLRQWRLITHHDSEYAHAHVLAFGDEEIMVKDRAFQEWALNVRRELARAQQHQLAEGEVAQQQEEQQRQKQFLPEQQAAQKADEQRQLEQQETARQLEREMSFGKGQGLEM